MISNKEFSVKILLYIFTFFLLISCSTSNKITKSWLNPDANKESIKFKKVAVFGLVMKTATRKLIEEEISNRLVNTIAVPSYTIINEDDISDVNKVKSILTEQAYDGAIILKLINVENRESYSPGMYPNYYYSFNSYYPYYWGYMHDVGGTYTTNKIVTVEVNIYSLSENKLIWSGEYVTTNPVNIEKIIAKLSQSVKEELVYEGLLEQQEP